MIKQFLLLTATIIIEFFILWLFVRKNPLRIFFYAALINLFTWPIANYIYQNILNNFLLIELGVFFIEWILIMALFEIKYFRAILISFIANFITAAISFIISGLTPRA